MFLKPVAKNEWEQVFFRGYPVHDTCWAVSLGADDNVYVGVCCESVGGESAQLHRYDVKERKMQHLLDMGDITGERADSGHAAQGKIHFALCPASDGFLYGATHCTTPPKGDMVWNPYAMWGDPARSYPGGHIFRYDTATGEAVDYGIIFPNEGIPNLLLDEAKGCLYGVTYPKAHFFRVNLTGRDLKDFGRISSWYPLAMVFDSQKNIYTSDFNSHLIKYDVKQDKIVFFASVPPFHPWNRSRRCSWISDMCAGPDGKIYGVHYSNDRLFRFDPGRKVPEFEDLGPGISEEIRASHLRCMVPDRAGNIYYIARVGSPGYVWWGEFENILVRYHVSSGEKEIIGAMRFNGKKFSGWRGVCGTDGSIYIADVEHGNIPTRIYIYRPQGFHGSKEVCNEKR